MRTALALTFLSLSVAGATPALAQDLTPEEVKRLALEAILENPQIVMDAVALLREREAEAAAASAERTLTEQRDLLERDPNAPVLGNPDGDVTLVEFFDYNCPYCRRAGTVVQEMIAADPNLRVVYREWPVLGENSVLAARAALASRQQGKYVEFHWALMGFEGRITESVIFDVAETLGLDVDQLRADMDGPEVAEHIQTSMELSRSLGFSGTPSFVVGSQTAPGFLEREDMEALVALAREEGEG